MPDAPDSTPRRRSPAEEEDAASPPHGPQRRGAQSAGGPRLPDPWSRRGPLPLDGYFEREQFSPLLMALGVLVIGFVAFQVIGALATVALLVAIYPANIYMAVSGVMGSELVRWEIGRAHV